MMTPDLRYVRLHEVLNNACMQAAEGKGEQRHGDEHPFEEQISCRINRTHRGYALGQALKKIDEAGRLAPDAAVRELLGAINMIAIEVITIRDMARMR